MSKRVLAASLSAQSLREAIASLTIGPRQFDFGTVTVPDLEVPRGPVTVPFAVVELPLFVVVPFTVDVPPFGPVTVPLPVVPVRVFATLAEPLTDLPRAPVAWPLALSVFPFCVTEPEAVEPLGPVTVF